MNEDAPSVAGIGHAAEAEAVPLLHGEGACCVQGATTHLLQELRRNHHVPNLLGHRTRKQTMEQAREAPFTLIVD